MRTSTPSDFTITPFDPKAASRPDWDAFHAHRRIRHQERTPDDPVTPDAVAEASMRHGWPDAVTQHYLARKGDQVVGSLNVSWAKPDSPSFESNKHLLWAWGAVMASERRKGLGTEWARHVLQAMEDHDTTTVTFDTDESSGHAFLKWLGAEEKAVGAENRLNLEDVDWDMVDEWVEEGRDRAPESELVFYEQGVPVEDRPAVAPAMGEMLNLMPFDDLEHGEIVVTPETMAESYARWADTDTVHHMYLTREPDGTISGITDITYIPSMPDRVAQRFTGVRTAYRGRGLGKLLKAAMLQYVRDTYPEAKWVTTGNADSNAPMLAINRRLGFKTYRGGSSYQMSREALRERLGRAS